MKKKEPVIIKVYLPWIDKRYTVNTMPPFTYWGLLPHMNFSIQATEVTETHGVYYMKENAR